MKSRSKTVTVSRRPGSAAGTKAASSAVPAQAANFILVADGPRFEAPALLLVGSLRQLHPPQEANILVYCPEASIASLSPFFREVLAFFAARLVAIPDGPSPFATPYPHGNKILAAALPREGNLTVFFDTDMIVLDRVLPALVAGAVGVVPEGAPAWGSSPETWVAPYALFGLDLPQERVRLVRGRRPVYLPYFNAGFVTWPEQSSFAQLWLDTAIAIDRAETISEKRPWLDQIALPVAIRRSQLKMNVLPEKYNFSYYRRNYPLEDEIAVAHYHLPGLFRGEIRALRAYQRILQALPPDMASTLRARTEPFILPGRPSRREGFVPLIDLDAPAS